MSWKHMYTARLDIIMLLLHVKHHKKAIHKLHIIGQLSAELSQV